MSKRVDELIQDVKEIRKAQADTHFQLAKYNALLDKHIEGVETLKAMHVSLERRVIPVEDHVKFLQGLLKVVALLSAIAGVAKVFL